MLPSTIRTLGSSAFVGLPNLWTLQIYASKSLVSGSGSPNSYWNLNNSGYGSERDGYLDERLIGHQAFLDGARMRPVLVSRACLGRDIRARLCTIGIVFLRRNILTYSIGFMFRFKMLAILVFLVDFRDVS